MFPIMPRCTWSLVCSYIRQSVHMLYFEDLHSNIFKSNVLLEAIEFEYMHVRENLNLLTNNVHRFASASRRIETQREVLVVGTLA